MTTTMNTEGEGARNTIHGILEGCDIRCFVDEIVDASLIGVGLRDVVIQIPCETMGIIVQATGW